LTHTSGIADDCEEEKGEDYSALFIDSPNYAIRENKDFLKNFAYKEPNFKSGENICYNNCAFVLLGLAIEKITGMGYREFITENIFKPFHMDNTFFAAKEDSDRQYADGYFYDEDGSLKKNIYSFPPIGTADSGAYTTVEDLDTFIREIKSSDVYGKMLLPQTDVKIQREDHVYTTGFGFELKERDGEVYAAFKEGCNDGVCNITVYYPEKDITFTILGNVDCNVWDMQEKAEKIIIQ
ncbi:MAG: serine hydrolase domain-containing protein, partial [Clostridium sp.]|nr:serine hydrolase domain-containing protein [Clostridium sp.]